jgi:hypothetical protein
MCSFVSYTIDPINKCKVAICKITKLSSSVVDKKTILVEYVAMEIEKIFTLENH